jgi:hypothetical protein
MVHAAYVRDNGEVEGSIPMLRPPLVVATPYSTGVHQQNNNSNNNKTRRANANNIRSIHQHQPLLCCVLVVCIIHGANFFSTQQLYMYVTGCSSRQPILQRNKNYMYDKNQVAYGSKSTQPRRRGPSTTIDCLLTSPVV